MYKIVEGDFLQAEIVIDDTIFSRNLLTNYKYEVLIMISNIFFVLFFITTSHQ